MFRKQCKAFDRANLSEQAREKLDFSGWYVSSKFDGYYIQIHTKDDSVRFFTSGGKEFYHEGIAKAIRGKVPNGIYECEYLGDGKGSLGDRGKAASIKTFLTEFEKGITSTMKGLRLVIFDVIPAHDEAMPFERRFNEILQHMSLLTDDGIAIYIAAHEKVSNNAEVEAHLARLVLNGQEGAMIKSPAHVQLEGKRVKTALKLKERHTIKAKVIGVEPGEGKYEGMIGALACVDSLGRKFRVGSGLTDTNRAKDESDYIGAFVVVRYERLDGNSYIQPTLASGGTPLWQ